MSRGVVLEQCAVTLTQSLLLLVVTVSTAPLVPRLEPLSPLAFVVNLNCPYQLGMTGTRNRHEW